MTFGGSGSTLNYFTRHRVPIANLVGVSEYYYCRPPMLDLDFEPPTPFGKRVRIVPPANTFSHKELDEVAAYLRTLINNRESDR